MSSKISSEYEKAGEIHISHVKVAKTRGWGDGMLRKGGRWEEVGGEETGVRPQQTLDANSIFCTEALIRWRYVYSAAQMKVFVGGRCAGHGKQPLCSTGKVFSVYQVGAGCTNSTNSTTSGQRIWR